MNTPHYQVMCTWGLSGAQSIPCTPDIYIWVDALAMPGDDFSISKSLPGESIVLGAGIADAFAVADWVTQHQLDVQRRLNVVVVCADEATHSVADELAAGAIIERLAHNGLDAMSPEAAVANAAYSQLKHATSHLISASEAAQKAAEIPQQLSVDESIAPDAVRVIRS